MVTGKSAKGLPPLRRSTLSKNHKRRRIKLKNYMKLISGLSIGYFNCIGTSLNGLIQEVKPKGIKTLQFLQNRLHK